MVYVTCASREEAKKIGEALVKERLAACANVLGETESVFFWENELKHEKETVLLLKTKESAYAAVEKRVKELHSYDMPCVLAFKPVKGSKEFLDWVERA